LMHAIYALRQPPPDVTPIICKEKTIVQEPPFIY
jgi:hypothetical protein